MVDNTRRREETTTGDGADRPLPPADFHAPPATMRQRTRRHALTGATLGVGLVIWIIFLVAATDVFLDARIYRAFATTTPLFAMIALALTLVVITREMDLSFGSVMALSMVGFVFVYEVTGNTLAAVLGCLLVGALCGMFNGYLVAILGIPSLIITLGTLFFFRGISKVLMDARPVVLREPEFEVQGLRAILNGRTLGIPNEMLWTVLVAIVLWIVLNRTRFGAHIFLVGDNAVSAELMGVRVARVKIATYVILGVVAAFTGLMAAMQLATFFPTLGEGTLLTPIASVFLGGTSVFGGLGSIVGSFVGAFIIGAIAAGVISAGIQGFYVELFFGLVIILSLIMQTLISRRMRG